MRHAKRNIAWRALALLLAMAGMPRAEEIWLQDNSRIYGLVSGAHADRSVTVVLPTGVEQKVPLEEIISIRFLGRNPLLIQSGTQEFRFINGGRLRGQIQSNRGDITRLQSAMAGPVDIDLARIKGFVALPLEGFSGRKAEELVESDGGNLSKALDVVLDTRGSTYPGVVRRLELTQLVLDHEELLREVPLKILYVAGVRLADGGRDPVKPASDDVQVRLWGRDDSCVQGLLSEIRLGKWRMQPLWEPDRPLQVDVEEITMVQVLGGRVQYLSQLTPVAVKEETVLAPPQPYRMDRSCQGDPISIAGKRYPWGIGMHANAEMTFTLNGRFKEFRSDIGIATRMGARGSVVFAVLGDGKELYRSPVVRGSATPAGTDAGLAKPLEVRVAVAGVKELTLKVTDADDLDLGDVANWGSARVQR